MSDYCVCGKDLPERLGDMVREAYELRDSIRVSGGDQSLGELHQSLVNARGSIDRIERIVADLTRLRGRAQAAYATTDEALDDRIDAVISKPSRTQIGDDYRTGREREAEWRLRTVDEQISARQSKRKLRDVETALDVCRTLHRGAESARQDLNTLIRAVSVETRLES
jgi:hypothetical protein